ncbi:hypothetical protein ACEQ8H_003096 [Pleosporales sp. CAS-2024a]
MAATMQQQQPSHPPALTFPRPIFAAVSPHPFLQAHLLADKKTAVRANGRAPDDFRRPGIHTSSLTHANGSAVVRLGNTSVVCGVRAEILHQADTHTHELGSAASQQHGCDDDNDDDDDASEIDALRLVVPNLELNTGSTPSSLPGNAPSSAAQSLVTRLRSLMLTARLVRASDLRIVYTPPANAADADEQPKTVVKAYWVLYIDIFFISLDGSAFDAAWISLLAALRDTRLPKAWWDDEWEGVLCSDEWREGNALRLRDTVVPATFAVFEGKTDEGSELTWVLSDPDAFEEGGALEARA